MPAYELLRPLSRLLSGTQGGAREAVPVPQDEPVIRTGDPLADRLLLIGNGPCAGRGVLTHQLGLPGTLSRALGARLDGPVDVDLIGGALLGIDGATEWLGDRATRGYRGALVIIGARDAAELIPATTWRRSLTDLFERLSADLPPGAPLFVSTVPTFDLDDHPLRRLLLHHTERLDALTRAVVSTVDRAVLIDTVEVEAENGRSGTAAAYYRALGERLADAMAPVLRAAPQQPVVSLRAPTAWAAVGLARESAESADELGALMRSACREFDVRGASITIADGENAWVAASAFDVPAWLPRHLTFCDTTLRSADMLIVPDVQKDVRFSDNPLNREFGTRFYAGHPVRDLGGERIGAVCLIDARPRSMSSVEIDRLRTLARRVELHLHALERQVDVAR